VITTCPEAFVVYGPAGLVVPQAPAGVGVFVKTMVSPATGALVGPSTVTVTVDVAAPLAGTSVGLAATVTVLFPVCVTVPGALCAVEAS